MKILCEKRASYKLVKAEQRKKRSTLFTGLAFIVSLGRDHCRTLYEDKLLPAAVRLKLVDLLTSLHAADMHGSWSSLVQRKKKKGPSNSSPVTVCQAMIRMVNDVDHAVRMNVARAVTALFLSPARSRVSDCARVTSTVLLLDQKGQEETFHQVMDSLRLAYFISDDLHEMSSEDESVNRVSSRIYSLQLVACVSPVCERKVVSELVLAVKRGHIEADLVDKVCALYFVHSLNLPYNL